MSSANVTPTGRRKKPTFKEQKARALKRVRENPEYSSAIGNKLPQKRFFRSRAHCNPLSHNDAVLYPKAPGCMYWRDIFPDWVDKQKSVSIVDIGCGFGGLTLSLAREFPNERVVGLEIRPKVCEYVRRRIQASRNENKAIGLYKNAGVLLTNAMKYLPNYFHKAQLLKMFFCFADPHFKKKNHRRRIISDGLLHIYSYLLRPGGVLYTITDVEELHVWIKNHCGKHPCFKAIKVEKDTSKDICIRLMRFETEESKKVDREGRKKYVAVYQRIQDPNVKMIGFAKFPS